MRGKLDRKDQFYYLFFISKFYIWIPYNRGENNILEIFIYSLFCTRNSPIYVIDYTFLF